MSAKDQSPNGPKQTGAKKAPAKGLGRGLSSLLGEAAPAVAATVTESGKPQKEGGGRATDIRLVPVEWINPGPWQPRRIFDKSALEELAQSMSENGIIQPILVRPNPQKPGRYELIAGERRWRAAQIAQLHDIPTIIRDFSTKQATEISLIENIQRQDLTAIEEGLGYRALLDAHDYTQDQLAEIVGKSRPHISNMMRLLSLPDEIHDMILSGALTAGQARPLIGHEDALALAKQVVENQLSAREVEKLARHEAAEITSKEKTEKSSDIKALEKRAKDLLGLRLSVNWDEKTEKGAVKFAVSSFDQLDMLLEKLGLNADQSS